MRRKHIELLIKSSSVPLKSVHEAFMGVDATASLKATDEGIVLGVMCKEELTSQEQIDALISCISLSVPVEYVPPPF